MSVVNFEAYRESKAPHTVSELMCIACLKRWVGVYPSHVWLRDLECPHCCKTGTIIKTGQDIDDIKEAAK